MSTPGSYASPGSAASPSSSVASSAPSPYVAIDGSDLTFPNECPENGKIIFPGRELLSSITEARPGMSETFATSHRNIILIYDVDPSAHQRHYQLALQMLQSQKIGWDDQRCMYARGSPREVGFAFARGGGRRAQGLMIVDVERGE